MFSSSLLDGILFKSLSREDALSLETPFLEEEVHDAIWNYDGNTSLGPDRFNLVFYNACWPFLKLDLLAFVNDLHVFASLPKVVTTSFFCSYSQCGYSNFFG